MTSVGQEFQEIDARLRAFRDPANLLAALLAHSPDPLQVFDAAGRSAITNRAFLDLFGAVPPAKHSMLEGSHALAPLVRRALAGETIVLPAAVYDASIFIGAAAKGASHEIGGTLVPLRGPDGDVAHVALVFQQGSVRNRAAAGNAEQRRLEAALAESEQSRAALAMSQRNLNEAQRLAHIGSWFIPLEDLEAFERNPLYWSDEVFRIFGHEPGAIEVSHATFINAVHPDDRDAIMRAVEDALDGGSEYDITHRVLRPDGTERIVREHAVIERDKRTGRPRRMLGSIQDITEQIAATRALRASEERLRLLFRANPLPMWVFDRETLRFVAVNESACRTYGYSEEEFLAMTIDDIRPPEEVARLHEFLGREHPAQFTSRRWRHRRRDGEIFDVDIYVHDVEYEGRARRVVTPCDVTAQVAAERALAEINAQLENRVDERTSMLNEALALQQALTEHAPQVIWFTDAAGVPTYFNKAWYEMAGGSRAEWVRPDWSRILHPDDRPGVVASWKRAIATGTDYEGEARYLAANGVYRTYSFRGAPVRAPDGAIAFWVGVNTDITQRKHAEDGLRDAVRELEGFAYKVSHDLRAPLRSIDGFSRILAEEHAAQLDAQGQDYLRRVSAAARNMGRLIEDLLLFSRAGRDPIHAGAIDMDGLVRGAIESLRTELEGRNVEWRIGALPPAHADRKLLTQAVTNLLANAVKFTRPTAAAVIDVGFQNDGGQPAYFVRDNGVGFDMQYADRLFSIFQRLHRADEFEGSGVGLAVVRRIIERHGGTIRAQAEDGKGATFRFSLPGAPA